MELDNYDLKILNLMQVDARTAIERIANEVGLSTASVQRRLKRLRENKVISAEVAVVSPKAVDRGMTFLLSVELDRDNVDLLKKFKARIQKDPRVQQCYYVTGDSDFVLIVAARDMEEFDAFIQALLANDSNIRHYKTSVVMERTKVSLALPIGQE